jgi:hypothetical protein
LISSAATAGASCEGSLFIDPLADSHYPRGRSENWHGDGILTYIEEPTRAERLRCSAIPTVEPVAYRLDRKLPLVAHDDAAVGEIAADQGAGRGAWKSTWREITI